MARIPDEVVERLKQEVSLQRLAEARGVKLVRRGADLQGLCPFHDDREPSLVISPKKNIVAAVAPAPAPAVRVDGEEIHATLGPRTYRVLGLFRNTTLGTMKVNVRVSGRNVRGEECRHGDTLDRELARQRAAFVKQAAHELGAKEDAIQAETGKLWTALEDLLRAL